MRKKQGAKRAGRQASHFTSPIPLAPFHYSTTGKGHKALCPLSEKRARLDANDVQGNLEPSAQIRALRKELNDDTGTQSALTPTPPTEEPQCIPDEPSDAEAPASKQNAVLSSLEHT